MNVLIIATLAVGLVIDQHWARYGQVVVSAAVWLVLMALWMRSDSPHRRAFFACLAFATAGEVFLSLVWGLYEYRLGNIPLFVPPGHVLLYFLGTQICARIPDGGEWMIAVLAAPVIGLFAWNGADTMGPVLYAVFLVCMAASPSRKLYATMFILSLALELYGTWIGNWIWAARVPYLGLTADNPPIAAGAFYCALDFLVVTFAGKMRTVPIAAGPPRLSLQRGQD